MVPALVSEMEVDCRAAAAVSECLADAAMQCIDHRSHHKIKRQAGLLIGGLLPTNKESRGED